MLTKILPWHKIGLPEGRAGTLPELQEYYGDAWPAFAKYYLPTQRLISSISCPKPGGPGCPKQVIVHSYNDIVAVCGNSPKECEPVEISRRDAIIYELKVEKLLSEFAQLFNVKGTTPENIMPLTWNLGTYAADDLPGMSVYLSLQSDAQELQFVVISLLAQKEKPFILLIPSKNSCPVSVLGTIQNAGVHLVGIDEIQGRQEKTDSADLLGQFVFAKLTETDPGEENYFRFEKDYWQVRFRGKPCSIKHSVGIQYITHLIQRAYNDEPKIHVSDLFYLVKGRPIVKNTELDRLTKEQLSKIGLDVAGLGNGLDMMTPEGKKRAISQVQQLTKQIEEAEKYGHAEEALRLRETKETLEDHIKKAYGLSGRARKTSDPIEKTQEAVSKAIENALVKMGKKKEDELAVYLDDHLDKGLFCSFRKDPDISWKIMKK